MSDTKKLEITIQPLASGRFLVEATGISTGDARVNLYQGRTHFGGVPSQVLSALGVGMANVTRRSLRRFAANELGAVVDTMLAELRDDSDY